MSLSDDGAIALWRIDRARARTGRPKRNIAPCSGTTWWSSRFRPLRLGAAAARRSWPSPISSCPARRGAISRSTGAMGCFSSIRFSSAATFVVRRDCGGLARLRLGMPVPCLSAPLAALSRSLPACCSWPGRFLMLDLHVGRLDFRRRSSCTARARVLMRGWRASAQELARSPREGGYDEIVFTAHSLGCALKIAVVDRALQTRTGFRQGRRRRCQLAFHRLFAARRSRCIRRAGWMSEAVARVSANPSDLLGRLPVHGRLRSASIMSIR